MRIVAVERVASAIAKRVVIRRRPDVVGVLNKLGYGRSVDGLVDVLVVPTTNIGEMDPVVRVRALMREVVVQDRAVSCLSTQSKIGVLSYIADAE
jgi:hypothetical protein